MKASVTGVYGTAHFPEGDVDTGPPAEIHIDCERMTFVMPAGEMPFDSDGPMDFTFHFGVTHVALPWEGSVRVRRGDNLTVVQELNISEMVRGT